MSAEREQGALTPEEVRSATDVSRETLIRLEAYVDLLAKWQKAVNLVGPSTLKDVWRRHILDSLQLMPYSPEQSASALDLGSGAGLPGLVLAIAGVKGMTLVESDARKVAFLREAARVTETELEVFHGRIEMLPAWKVDLVTARALTSVAGLLGYTWPYLKPGGRCLFLKGRGVDDELKAAESLWEMRVTKYPSRTAPDGVILQLEGIRHVGDA
ncbi:MAG: 16S rRNA (guanine(527)-N(7))-methyltransferase RsmG [Oceanibaculum nanhaiense]|uniref:16S rRNA (guanine(527)-N(7))-methyltransferase RsmG n=1 Tax=Oceanibaculum nanhaiense TaxID=1909734 RepID=UPI0025A328C1|nr:16S rRNA (guanine(527)-N(7))-methyltransferase RsmG [Oceanibaculum nanhaiense]MDM7945821.1 16S rRNA (guanine(527)-N(7))-methyltransferase RsmG [Oceanibaculum nanhaiense]